MNKRIQDKVRKRMIEWSYLLDCVNGYGKRQLARFYRVFLNRKDRTI